MANGLEEGVKENKLNSFRLVANRLTRPLPEKLKRLAQHGRFDVVAEKLQQLPAFLSFEPLDGLDQDALPEQQKDLESPSFAEIKQRMVAAQRVKHKRAKDKTAVSLSQVEVKREKAHLTSLESQQEITAIEREKKPVLQKQKSGHGREYDQARSHRPDDTSVTSFRQPNSSVEDSIQDNSANSAKSPLKSAPRMLAVLLEQIAGLGENIETSPSTDNVSQQKKDKLRKPLAKESERSRKKSRLYDGGLEESVQRSSVKKESFPHTISKQHKRSTTASDSISSISSKLRTAAISESCSANAEPEHINLLRSLVAPVLQNKLSAETKSHTSAITSRETPPGLANFSENVAQTSSGTTSITSFTKLDASTEEALRTIEQTEHAPSLSQAEELAEHINQVIREQAWLRGVNLP